jgi:hypothetical protein
LRAWSSKKWLQNFTKSSHWKIWTPVPDKKHEKKPNSKLLSFRAWLRLFW